MRGTPDFVDDWLDGQRIRLQTTWKGNSAVVRLYLRPAFTGMPLDEVRSRDLNRLYARLLKGVAHTFQICHQGPFIRSISWLRGYSIAPSSRVS
jgi:hypothetical protein